MSLKKYNISRTIVFSTLAAAMASTKPLGYWEIAVIKGDNTRFKRGDGIKYSGDGTLPFVGSTFAQLPWYKSSADASAALAVNVTATLTAAQMLARYFTSTSVAAVTITTDTATNLAAALGAVQGTEFDFEIDNSGGANTVTVALGTGITAATSPITGGSTLTVIAGTFGKFKIIFKSATTALIFRTL